MKCPHCQKVINTHYYIGRVDGGALAGTSAPVDKLEFYTLEQAQEWIEQQSHKAERVSKLRQALDKVPLSAFKASDVRHLCKLYSVDSGRVAENVLRRFEEIAKKSA